MPNLENLRKQAKQLVRWHRERNYSVAERIRAALPPYSTLTDAQILAVRFTLTMAQDVIAHELGFRSWAALKTGVESMHTRGSSTEGRSTLRAAYPQLFVSSVGDACAYYTRVLGFTVVFVHGDPPFYGQLARDAIRLNLRYVCAPPMDKETVVRESLLSAYIEVSGIKELYGELKAAGAEFQQSLKREPWGVSDFVVQDPDGNLLCFAEARLTDSATHVTER